MAVKRDLAGIDTDMNTMLGRVLHDAFDPDNGGGMQNDIKAYGAEGTTSYMLWDYSEDKFFIYRTTSDTAPGRLAYIQHIGSAMAEDENIQGIQIRSRATGTGTIAGGTDGAEIKSGLNSDSDTGTIAQARGVIANVDAKKGTITTAHLVEAQADIGSGGQITTLKGVRASLNNSGTLTNSYAFIVETANVSYPWKYGLYMASGQATYPVYIANAPSGGTAQNQIELLISDTHSHSTGYARGVYVNWTHASGNITGDGEINALAADVAVTTGNVTYCFAASLYTGAMGTGTVSHVEALYIYMDDIGGSASCTNKYGVDINIDNGDGATNCAFIRCYNHGGTINAFAHFPGSGAEVDDLFWFAASTGCLSVDAGTPGNNSTHKIRVRIAGSYAYIPLYADY